MNPTDPGAGSNGEDRSGLGPGELAEVVSIAQLAVNRANRGEGPTVPEVLGQHFAELLQYLNAAPDGDRLAAVHFFGNVGAHPDCPDVVKVVGEALARLVTLAHMALNGEPWPDPEPC